MTKAAPRNDIKPPPKPNYKQLNLSSSFKHMTTSPANKTDQTTSYASVASLPGSHASHHKNSPHQLSSSASVAINAQLSSLQSISNDTKTNQPSTSTSLELNPSSPPRLPKTTEPGTDVTNPNSPITTMAESPIMTLDNSNHNLDHSNTSPSFPPLPTMDDYSMSDQSDNRKPAGQPMRHIRKRDSTSDNSSSMTGPRHTASTG